MLDNTKPNISVNTQWLVDYSKYGKMTYSLYEYNLKAADIWHSLDSTQTIYNTSHVRRKIGESLRLALENIC